MEVKEVKSVGLTQLALAATVGAGAVTQLHPPRPHLRRLEVVQSAQRLVRNVVALALLMDLPVAVDVTK